MDRLLVSFLLSTLRQEVCTAWMATVVAMEDTPVDTGLGTAHTQVLTAVWEEWARMPAMEVRVLLCCLVGWFKGGEFAMTWCSLAGAVLEVAPSLSCPAQPLT